MLLKMVMAAGDGARKVNNDDVSLRTKALLTFRIDNVTKSLKLEYSLRAQERSWKVVDTKKFEAGRSKEIASGTLHRTSRVTSDDELNMKIVALMYVVTGCRSASR